jgi:competence protein ComEC
MGSRLSRTALLALAFLFALLTPTAILEKPNFGFHEIVFWNVGQGDFATIGFGNQCLIFDPGGNRRISIPMRKWFEHCRSITLFVSHFDKDHLCHCNEIAATLPVKRAYFSHLDAHTSIGKKCLEGLKRAGAKIETLAAGQAPEPVAAGVTVKVLWPPRNLKSKLPENDHSLLLLVSVGSRRVLFTGDLPSREEKRVIKKLHENVAADILKVGHHGSHSSSSDLFLQNVKAANCVISSGRGNSYGHPHRETLERLAHADCAILRTDTLGTIKFTF